MGLIIRLILKEHLFIVAALYISACATTNTPAPNSGLEASPSPIHFEISDAPIAQPEPNEPPILPDNNPPTPDVLAPAVELEVEVGTDNDSDTNPAAILKITDNSVPNEAFADLDLWPNADPSPALEAFQKTCKVWRLRADNKWLNTKLPTFGQYADWRPSCLAAKDIQVNRSNSIQFFQNYFKPVMTDENTGLLTAYYAPEIPVRRLASLEFSEPILARPQDKKTQHLPRKDLSVTSSTVLAYGKPIDVFFLQIQGSGQIRFPDGKIYRAAFDGHNNKPYSSIGRVLISRGDMTKDEASKQSIEAWMEKEGYLAAKKLMAENARYVFFKTEHINQNIGPKGAMGIPLTPMGSLAVDPKFYPYGTVVWVEGKFPKEGGDYIGEDVGHLLIAQDTGGAIKGKKRGDVFFGSGGEAGEKAGVMKHRATWSLFLPVALALKLAPVL